MRPLIRRGALPLAAWVCGLAACTAAPPTRFSPGDPIVYFRTQGGGELGVSTPYGVVFLGHTAKSGEVEFEVRFADGPSYETGIVEPIGDDLYVTHAEIELPTVPLSYSPPEPGRFVTVRGRWLGGIHQDTLYELRLEVASDERVEGILLATSPELTELGILPIGAAVFVEEEEETRLVGLVTGRLEFEADASDPERASREYLTVVGPDRLWHLVTHGRANDRRPRKVYRRDVLP